jgi:hypothetical protein
MITTTLLVFLGALLAMVLWKMFKPGPAGSSAPAVSATPPTPAVGAPAAADLLTARAGDVISIHAAAEDFSDIDFTVDRRSMYQSGPKGWADLSGDYRGNRVYLEVQPGAPPEIMGIFDTRRLTLPDVGATEQQMADFDTRQDPSAFLTFEGKRWQYESSRELGYFENEIGEGEGLYRWIFREAGGDRLLCIEKWEGEPFDVRIARRVNPQDVTVFKAA